MGLYWTFSGNCQTNNCYSFALVCFVWEKVYSKDLKQVINCLFLESL